MRNLTDAQFLLIQRYVDMARAELEGMGLSITVEDDFRLWVAEMRKAPSIASISTTFDPTYSDIDHRNGYWLSFRDADGQFVACTCSKLFRRANAVHLIRSQHLFFDRKPRLDYTPAQIALPDDAAIIEGDLVYLGGLWIHPSFRGRNTSSLIQHLHKALGMRHFDPDWQFGFVADTPKRTAMAKEGYGSGDSFTCIAGHYPPKNADARYRIAYSARHQILRELMAGVEEVRTLAPAAPA